MTSAFEFNYYEGPARTRSGNDRIMSYRPKSKVGENIPSVKAAKVWEKIPNDIKNVGSLKSFKERYKSSLL